MNENGITVCIPSIPPRSELLMRAVRSVLTQTLRPDALVVQIDREHDGAAYTRHTALSMVRTPWVAFLDDDDEMLPTHLEDLLRHALETNADYVYSWFETVPFGHDPFPRHHFTNPFDPKDPIQTTITTLVRTKLAQEVGFWAPQDGATIDGQRWGEDYTFTLDCLKRGAKIEHLVKKTWWWHHDSGNTSGRGDRW